MVRRPQVNIRMCIFGGKTQGRVSRAIMTTPTDVYGKSRYILRKKRTIKNYSDLRRSFR